MNRTGPTAHKHRILLSVIMIILSAVAVHSFSNGDKIQLNSFCRVTFCEINTALRYNVTLPTIGILRSRIHGRSGRWIQPLSSTSADDVVVKSDDATTTTGGTGSTVHKTVSDKEYKLDDIVNLCKRKGFVFQSSEIYSPMAGFYDYGPMGVELKANIKKLW